MATVPAGQPAAVGGGGAALPAGATHTPDTHLPDAQVMSSEQLPPFAAAGPVLPGARHTPNTQLPDAQAASDEQLPPSTDPPGADEPPPDPAEADATAPSGGGGGDSSEMGVHLVDAGGGGGKPNGDVPANMVFLPPLPPLLEPTSISKLLVPVKKSVTQRYSCRSVSASGSLGLSLPVPDSVAVNLVRPSDSALTKICVSSATL